MSLTLLTGVEAVREPFASWRVASAADDTLLDAWSDLFAGPLPWVRHDSFYHCDLADLDVQVPEEVRHAVGRRLAEITGLPLHPDVTVTAQRMHPGDHAEPHSDAPRLGYEAVRAVVQLDGDGDAARGGVFHTHPSAEGMTTTWSRPPRRGQAVVMLLDAHSHHSVSPTTEVRRTLVFHARHRANDPRVEALVNACFEGFRLDRLPDELTPIMDAAEATHPEEVTRRAAEVAWVLGRWGVGPETAGAAYTSALAPIDPRTAPWLTALAAWVSTLRADGFDHSTWRILADRTPPSDETAHRVWDAIVGRARDA